MFCDSRVLKDELVSDLDNVEDRLRDTDEENQEGALIAVEQFVFGAAFAIRKLADSYKLSDEFEANSWEVTAFPKRPSAPSVDILNWHRLDRHYDFASPRSERLGLRQLCGVLVHSSVFMRETASDGRTLTGLLFNADRTKNTCLYRISWDGFSQVIRDLHDDDVVDVHDSRRTGELRKKGPQAVAQPASEA